MYVCVLVRLHIHMRTGVKSCMRVYVPVCASLIVFLCVFEFDYVCACVYEFDCVSLTTCMRVREFDCVCVCVRVSCE